ncbi:TldD/PmbA family protein [uncultured Acetatifactor sp.]|uniref:TldD/PmbA family protein n=1 Tax=uncultured Acetatifactor sp. TaxID=1671927 RepID=UPI002608028B|nr:metallopeptidase TldD-related protein [uncultured Acetatifactor sp.]
MGNQMTYQEFKEEVIRIASREGIADYELYYTESESTSVEIFKEEVKGYSIEDSMGICLRCIIDGRAGYASTENLTAEEAASLVSRAVDNARSIESQEESPLHHKGDAYASLEEGQCEAPDGTALVDAALNLQKEMYQVDSRVADGTQSYLGHVSERYALCNSNSLDLEDKVSYTVGFGIALVSDGGEMYDGSEDKRGRLQDFDMKEIAGKAVEEALSTIGAGSVPSGQYTVVFSNKAMATLLGTYSDVFSAEQAQKGMSLLKGKEGEKVAADIITIVDDPLYKDSVTKRTFDGEGVATYAKNVVENGTLTTLLYNLKTAAVAGVKSTGNASKASYASVVGTSPFTFFIRPAEEKCGLEDMLAAAGSGIYVTEVTGLHAGANSVTGDFSLSSVGFRIVDGRKDAPVKNFTVSGNFFTLLKEIEKVGSDLDFSRGKFGAPSVLARDISVAGNSEG